MMQKFAKRRGRRNVTLNQTQKGVDYDDIRVHGV